VYKVEGEVFEEMLLSQWAKSLKKQSVGSAFLLIRHSKYSAILSNQNTPTDCFFSDFDYWDKERVSK